MLEKIKFEKFTAFDSLDIPLSTGINIFIGANGTGKTHILKAIYATCDVAKSQKSLAEKTNRVFLPSGEHIGRLVKKASLSGYFEVTRRVADRDKSLTIRLSLTNHIKEPVETHRFAKMVGFAIALPTLRFNI